MLLSGLTNVFLFSPTDTNETQRVMSASLILDANTISIIVSWLDKVESVVFLTMEEMELMFSRPFRLFCDLQEKCNDRFVTKNLKMYELVLKLTACHDQTSQHEELIKVMEIGGKNMNEGDYIMLCRKVQCFRDVVTEIHECICPQQKDFVVFNEDNTRLIVR